MRALLYLDFANGQVVEMDSTDTIENVLPVGYVVSRNSEGDPAEDFGGEWSLLGTTTIGEFTIYHYVRIEV